MKFKFYQQVKVKDGFFKGCLGRVIDVYINNEDKIEPPKYSYTVEIQRYHCDREAGYVELFKEKEAYCKEEDLE